MKKSIAFVYMVFAVVVIFAVVAVAFAFAYPFEKYDREWMIGKTYDEVVEEYGDFLSYRDYSHRYEKYSVGKYLLEEERVGFLGTTPEVYLMVVFDSNGVVSKCYEEPGGIGG